MGHVIYYPPGETMFNGKTTDNSLIARVLLDEVRKSGDVDAVVPFGWRIAKIESNERKVYYTAFIRAKDGENWYRMAENKVPVAYATEAELREKVRQSYGFARADQYDIRLVEVTERELEFTP